MGASSDAALAPAERGRQLLALLALAAGAAYLTWRWGFTLDLGSLWLGLPLVVVETWALIATAMFVFSSWRLTVRTPPPASTRRSTAVLIPTYNEPPDVLRPTILGALAVRGTPGPEVWVLDDGDRAWVREMCSELGVRYLVRPAPRQHAKAGNINHALEHVNAELLLVVDADHVPLPHALERTLGYFEDPEVAFVQTPQVFFNRGFQHPRSTDDPLLNEQSLFYDVICRGKDRHGAAFWCGSSAVLRLEALLSVGGVATETVVEDTHTAMRLHAAGWKSVYHYEVLAVGLAPEEVTSFLTQRGRWARGSFQVLRLANPLFVRGLSWRSRLHYFSSVSHYFEGPQRLVGILVPALALLTGTAPLSAPVALWLMLFLPPLVLVPIATKAMARGRMRLLDAERYALARTVVYTKAAAALFTRSAIPFAVTPKGADGQRALWRSALRWQMALAGLCAVAVAYQSLAQLLGLPGRLTPFAFGVTVVWACLSAGFLADAVHRAATVRHRRRAHRFPARLEATYSVGERGPRPASAIVTDLSPFGLALQPATSHFSASEGDQVLVDLRLPERALELEGTVVRVETGEGAPPRIGVRLDDVSQEARDTITRWCFAHPFGPSHPVVVGSDAALPPIGEAELQAA